MITDLFWELLQVAVGNRRMLSQMPSYDEWGELRSTASKHNVAGVMFSALERLPQEQVPERRMLMKWYMPIKKIREKNDEMTSACRKVTRMFERDGFETCILKGQGNTYNYNITTEGRLMNIGRYRKTGDIDIWVWPSERLMKYIAECKNEDAVWPVSIDLSKKITVRYVWQRYGWQQVEYHHMVTPMLNDVMVETHFMPSVFLNPFTQRKAVRWFEQMRDCKMRTKDGFCVPLPRFNVVYQLMHLYRHYLLARIGLRQMVDYYFTVMSLYADNQESNIVETVKADIRMFGMQRFLGAVMYIMNVCFGMDDKYMLCQPNERLGKKLLREISDVDKMIADQEKEQEPVGMIRKGVAFIKRNICGYRHVKEYPSEAIWTTYLYLRMSYDTRRHACGGSEK